MKHKTVKQYTTWFQSGSKGSSPTNRSLRRDQRGLSTVEYLIIFALIAAGGISLWSNLGGVIKARMGQSTDALNRGANFENPGQE